MYFIYTNEHGFEPKVFTNKADAMANGQTMHDLAAYRGLPIHVYFAAEADLKRIMTVDL